MSKQFSGDTSIPVQDDEPRGLAGLGRSIASATLFLKMATAGTHGIQQCFLEGSAATQQTTGVVADSSTQLHEMTAELRARLDSMLTAARHGTIEDGMTNAINERLPALIAKDFNAVISALVPVIENGRTTPIVAAEVLKELGRIRNVASHWSRRWVLERALRSPWPFTRDGAGLGLARLGDPGAIPSLRRAVETETHSQTRADLQIVVDELADLIPDGEPVAKRY